MKKQLLTIFAITILNTVVNAQCSTNFVTNSNCAYDPINTFSMNGIASGGNNNTEGSCNANGYYSFANPLRTLTIGETINWTATVGHGFGYEGISIWIDLNNNEIFETTELVATTPTLGVSYNQNFVMPTGVTGIPLKMRLRCTYNNTPTADQACTNGIGAGYGETEDYFVLLAPSLGTNSFEQTTKVTVYPNPSNSIFTIAINNNATIEVCDIVGKQIFSKNLFTGENIIDLDAYEKGIYLAKITNQDNQTKSIKLIKE
jgi:hypothetical protein